MESIVGVKGKVGLEGVFFGTYYLVGLEGIFLEEEEGARGPFALLESPFSGATGGGGVYLRQLRMTWPSSWQ